jgi:hypothetical protein
MKQRIDLAKIGIDPKDFKEIPIEKKGERAKATAIRMEKILSDQLVFIGIVLLVIGCSSFLMTPEISIVYISLWKSITFGGLMGSGTLFILLGLLKKKGAKEVKK